MSIKILALLLDGRNSVLDNRNQLSIKILNVRDLFEVMCLLPYTKALYMAAPYNTVRYSYGQIVTGYGRLLAFMAPTKTTRSRLVITEKCSLISLLVSISRNLFSFTPVTHVTNLEQIDGVLLVSFKRSRNGNEGKD